MGFPLHKSMDEQFGSDPCYVSLQIQTVFEKHDGNTFELGLLMLKKHGINSVYGFDPGTDNKLSNIYQSYRMRGTPWTVLIDHTGKVIISQFSSRIRRSALPDAISAALSAAAQAEDDAEGAEDDDSDAPDETPEGDPQDEDKN